MTKSRIYKCHFSIVCLSCELGYIVRLDALFVMEMELCALRSSGTVRNGTMRTTKYQYCAQWYYAHYEVPVLCAMVLCAL